MFYSAAKTLTLLGVLIHAGMGCCAHHDHCLVRSPAPVKVQEVQKTIHCSCTFHAAHGKEACTDVIGDDRPGNHSCPCGEDHGDCADHCFWLTNSQVELPSDTAIILPFAMVNGFGTYAFHDAAAALHGDPPRPSELTYSLRAKTQVWRL